MRNIINFWLKSQAAKIVLVLVAGCGNMVDTTDGGASGRQGGGGGAGCENLDNDTNPDGSERCDGVDDPIVVDPEGYIMFHVSVLPANPNLFAYGNGFGQDPSIGNDWCDPRNPMSPSDDGEWFREYLPDIGGGMSQYYMTAGTVDACVSGDFAHWANLTGEAASSDEALVESECGDGYAVCIGWVSGMLIATGDCDRINDVCSDI